MRALLSHREVGLNAQTRKAAEFCITAQRKLPGSRKSTDIEVEALDAKGQTLGRLWVESKTSAREGRPRGKRPQFSDEFDVLHALGPTPGSRLLVITKSGDDLNTKDRPSGFEVGHLRWGEVLDMILEVGRASQGADWIEAAHLPDSPAKQRILAECLWYLVEVARVRPLDGSDEALKAALNKSGS
jgi:hypothetical protein